MQAGGACRAGRGAARVHDWHHGLLRIRRQGKGPPCLLLGPRLGGVDSRLARLTLPASLSCRFPSSAEPSGAGGQAQASPRITLPPCAAVPCHATQNPAGRGPADPGLEEKAEYSEEKQQQFQVREVSQYGAAPASLPRCDTRRGWQQRCERAGAGRKVVWAEVGTAQASMRSCIAQTEAAVACRQATEESAARLRSVCRVAPLPAGRSACMSCTPFRPCTSPCRATCGVVV